MGVRVVVDQTRADKILSHLATHRVSTREIVETHLFGGRNVKRELWELASEKGLITAHSALSRRRSYYQLTSRGASSLGLSDHFARPLGAQSLLSNLSLAWFCCMGRLDRRRVERDVIAQRVGFAVTEGYYCVEKDDAKYRILRAYIPMPTTRVNDIMRSLSQLVAHAKENPQLDELIRARAFGFAVLLETEPRAEAVQHRVRSGFADRTALAASAFFRVESVPDFLGHKPDVGRANG